MSFRLKKPKRRISKRASATYRVKRGYGTIKIVNKEYLLDLIVASTYTGQFLSEVIELNPGLTTTLPWGNRIFSNYQEWRGIRWKFYYKPTCAAAVAVNTGIGIGAVMMACQYNPSELPFNNKAEMLNYMGSKSAAPAENLTLTVRCKGGAQRGNYQIRTQSVTGTDNQKFYDLGDFTIAYQGVPPGTDNYALGELWTAYTLLAFKPKLQYFSNAQMDVVTFTSPSTANRLGTAWTYGNYHDLGGVLSANAVTMPLNLPPGRYMIIWYMAGTVAGAGAYTVPTFTYTPAGTTTGATFFGTGSSNLFAPVNGLNPPGTNIQYTQVFDYIGGSPSALTITLSGGANWPTGTTDGTWVMIGLREPIV